MREPAVIIRPAIDPAQAAADIDRLLGKIGEGEAFVGTAQRALHEWRCQIGGMLRQVRATMPQRGPKAKAWGDFVAQRGLSLDTAANYMKLAEHRERYPIEAAGMNTIDAYRSLGLQPPVVEVSRSTSGNSGVGPADQPPTAPPSEVVVRPGVEGDSSGPSKESGPVETGQGGGGSGKMDGRSGDSGSRTDRAGTEPRPSSPVKSDPADDPSKGGGAVSARSAPPDGDRQDHNGVAPAAEARTTLFDGPEADILATKPTVAPVAKPEPAPATPAAPDLVVEIDQPEDLTRDLESIAKGVRGVKKMWPFDKKAIAAFLRRLADEVES